MPWIAMGFMTLYLQLLGFSDATAAGLIALLRLGFSLGGVLGGLVGQHPIYTMPVYIGKRHRLPFAS